MTTRVSRNRRRDARRPRVASRAYSRSPARPRSPTRASPHRFPLPLFHLRSPPGFLRGSVGRRRPVQAAQHASPRRRARALRADDPTLPKTSPISSSTRTTTRSSSPRASVWASPTATSSSSTTSAASPAIRARCWGASPSSRNNTNPPPTPRDAPNHRPRRASSRARPATLSSPSLSFQNLPRGDGKGGDLPTPRGARGGEPDAVVSAMEPSDMLPETLVIAAADDAARDARRFADDDSTPRRNPTPDPTIPTRAMPPRTETTEVRAIAAGALSGSSIALARLRVASSARGVAGRRGGVRGNREARFARDTPARARFSGGRVAFADQNADPNEGGVRAARGAGKDGVGVRTSLSGERVGVRALARRGARGGGASRDGRGPNPPRRFARRRNARRGDATRGQGGAEMSKSRRRKDAAEAALERAAEDAARREAELRRRAIDAERDAARRVEAEAEASRERDATFEKLAESEKRLAAPRNAPRRNGGTARRRGIVRGREGFGGGDPSSPRTRRRRRARARTRTRVRSRRTRVRSRRIGRTIGGLRAPNADAARRPYRSALEASLASARAEAEASAATASGSNDASRRFRSRRASRRSRTRRVRRRRRRRASLQVAVIRADALARRVAPRRRIFAVFRGCAGMLRRARGAVRARAPENKRLHNASLGSIRVFCRVRPRARRRTASRTATSCASSSTTTGRPIVWWFARRRGVRAKTRMR